MTAITLPHRLWWQMVKPALGTAYNDVRAYVNEHGSGGWFDPDAGAMVPATYDVPRGVLHAAMVASDAINDCLERIDEALDATATACRAAGMRGSEINAHRVTVSHHVLRRLDLWIDGHMRVGMAKSGAEWDPLTYVNDETWSRAHRDDYATVVGAIATAAEG